MTGNSSSRRDKEGKEEEQRRIMNQIDLLNRLIESQLKGEKITFDLENPLVRAAMQRLEDTLRKKLGKGEKGEEEGEEK